MCVLCVIAYKDTHPPLLYNTKETGISQWLQVSSAEPSLISVILMLHMMPACMETHGLNGELRSSWLLWQVTDTVFLLTVSDPWDSDMNLTCFTLARVTLIRVLDILYFPFQEFLIIDWRDVGMAVASPIILFLFFWVLWPIQKCRDKKILMGFIYLFLNVQKQPNIRIFFISNTCSTLQMTSPPGRNCPTQNSFLLSSSSL